MVLSLYKTTGDETDLASWRIINRGCRGKFDDETIRQCSAFARKYCRKPDGYRCTALKIKVIIHEYLCVHNFIWFSVEVFSI